MAEASSIEWTDATWQIVTGCQVVSPGCTNCYAMKLAGTRLQHHPSRAGLTSPSKAGPVWNGKVRFNAEWLTQPLRWKRPRKIFVCAHGDLFADGVEDAWLDQVFAVMALAPRHTFQVLTKRPVRMRAYLTDPDMVRRVIHEAFRLDCEDGAWMSADHEIAGDPIFPLENVWLGVSAEDQVRADERIPRLLQTPAAVRFVSLEPLLGPIDLTDACEGWYFYDALRGERWHDDPDRPNPRQTTSDFAKLDWVILGGESGPGARPMHPAWARQIRDDCDAAAVPFFFKQWGNWAPSGDSDSPDLAIAINGEIDRVRPFTLPERGGPRPRWATMLNAGKKAAGRLLDGVEHNWMPGQGLG